ncbi:methyltransferase domain-containing protein [candidate division WOR-3 bacterium]|nr:methyltransferase domain-containing protein [candidate division WOR-3 bacterium]
MDIEQKILTRENELRAWFTRECDPVRKVVDGFDIGWGGIQRFVTREMIMQPGSQHLDVACGYGTFLAQLGWRFPEARLIGLNIDFQYPHASIHDLLSEAGVRTTLVQADARHMPFRKGLFSSASCFLGLQDIKIGSGAKGVQNTISEVARVVQQYGYVTLVDEFPSGEFHEYLSSLPLDVIKEQPLAIDVKWNRHIAEKAIELYAHGWVEQTELTDQEEKNQAFFRIYSDMKKHMEHQIRTKGYFVPFDSLRMFIMQRT